MNSRASVFYIHVHLGMHGIFLLWCENDRSNFRAENNEAMNRVWEAAIEKSSTTSINPSLGWKTHPDRRGPAENAEDRGRSKDPARWRAQADLAPHSGALTPPRAPAKARCPLPASQAESISHPLPPPGSCSSPVTLSVSPRRWLRRREGKSMGSSGERGAHLCFQLLPASPPHTLCPGFHY